MTVPEIDLASQYSQIWQLPLSKDTRDSAEHDLELLYQQRTGKKPNWMRIFAFNAGMPIPLEESDYTGA